jgi:hypothetical protein
MARDTHTSRARSKLRGLGGAALAALLVTASLAFASSHPGASRLPQAGNTATPWYHGG